MLLNNRSELVECMMNEGILHIIGDMIVSETDPLVLVCFFCLFSLIDLFFNYDLVIRFTKKTKQYILY